MKAWITQRPLLTVLFAALMIRLASLGAYPLMDTTEARYGYMARLMVETGNWLTPQFDIGVPFWGKPPLHTWMSAGSAQLLGMSEFALRLPHWLAGLTVVALVAWFAKRQRSRPLLAAMVLLTSLVFSIASGTVMTDMALTLGVTLAMMGFYQCWQGQRWAGYIGFVGLAIGLLAKGPLVLVLVGLAVLPWLLLKHGLSALKELKQRTPLLGGLALMLIIAMPWYLAAEWATPGFLEYFLMGEHFLRFVESGWQGDLYGSAHDQPRGTIWLFWLAAALPWSFVLPWLWFKRRGQQSSDNQNNGLKSLLLLWMLSPMVLFTFAGNILPAYVLPGIPALALLCSSLAGKDDEIWMAKLGVVTPLLLVITIGVVQLKIGDERSDKALLAGHNFNDAPLVYLGNRPFSAQFYSAGKAEQIKTPEKLAQYTGDLFLVLGSQQSWHDLPLSGQSCRALKQTKKRQLLECGPNALARLD